MNSESEPTAAIYPKAGRPGARPPRLAARTTKTALLSSAAAILAAVGAHALGAAPLGEVAVSLGVIGGGAAILWRQLSLLEARREIARTRRINSEMASYRLTFEPASVGMAHMSLDGRWLRVNDRLCEMLGFTRAELRQSEKLSFIHPEDRERAAQELQDIAAGKVAKHVGERRYVAKDGAIVPVWTSTTFIAGHDEASNFVAVVVEDISARKAAEEALKESEERFSLAMKGSNEGVWDWRLKDNRTYLSPRWKSMLGYEDHELADTPESWEPLLGPGDAEKVATQVRALEAGDSTGYEIELKMRHKNGHWVDILSRAFPVFDENHRMTRLVGTHLDISERKRAETDLRRAATVFASTHEGIIITDAGGRIERVNPAFQLITGYTEDEVRGQSAGILRSGRQADEYYSEMWRELKERSYWQGEIWNRRKDGAIYPEWLTISAVRNENGEVTNYIGAFTDITRLKQSEARLEYLAHYDPLTHLPNRFFLRERIQAAIAAGRISGETRAILYLDIDRFKTINDSLGHRTGDELLVTAAERWRTCLTTDDVLARVGGDEFVVLLEPATPQRAMDVANELIAEASKPFAFADGREAYVGLSVGVTTFPNEGDDADALLQQADSALYAAKANRTGVRFYAPALTQAARRQLDLEAGLRRGLERGELALQYQPLVSLADRRAFGVEALVRWRSPTGLIPPMQFIPMAERTGLIVALGEWVLREACTRMKSWLDAGYDLQTMAVNLSPRQFDLPDICERICAILEATGLPPSKLEIEITESALMEQGRNATRKLEELKTLGLRVAVDDFGTGHSSLSYLKHFPIDKLKLDRSFIIDIPGDPTSMEIAAAIIRLGQSLQLNVLAEGVETEAQADFLALAGCPTAQGYLFAKPLWEEELVKRLDGEWREAQRLTKRKWTA